MNKIWTSQPQQACEIDWSNPICRDIISAVHAPSGTLVLPSGTIQRLSQNTVPGKASRSAGVSIEFDGTNNSFSHAITPRSKGEITFVAWFYQNTSAVADKRICSVSLSTAGSGNHWSLGTGTTDGTKLKVSASNISESATASITNGFLKKAAATFGGTMELYDNGVKVATGATAISMAAYDRISYGSLVRSSNAAVLNGGIVFAASWNRKLSADEIKSVTDNPWQIFQPLQQRIFVPVSAGDGGVVGTASLIQEDQTVSASGSVTGAAGITGTASLTQAAQTLSAIGVVSLSGSATLNQSAQTLAATGAVAISASAILSQAAQTVASTGAVAVSGSVTLNQAAQTLSASGSVAAIGAITGTASIDQAPQTLSATGSVSIGGSASLTQDAQTVTASGAIQITGSANLAQLAQTLTASGVVLGGITGSADLVQAAQTLSASGTCAFPTIGRPTSDTENVGWTPSTGSDLYAMLDEVTPDDLDYISTSSIGSVCKMTLNATQYPGSAAQQLSLRASSSTGNGLLVVIKEGATTIATRTLTLTPTYDLHTITLTAGEIAAITSGNLTVEMTST